MKSKITHVATADGKEWDCLTFVCPGCESMGMSGVHQLPVNTDQTSPSWTWDGNLEVPTLHPSILSFKDDPKRRCHSFLRSGVFEFLTDCGHELKGQHVPMPDLPDWMADENETST